MISVESIRKKNIYKSEARVSNVNMSETGNNY